MNKKLAMKELVYIAMGVAAIIGGGFFIFQMSLIFPIPGVKYILMSPYLSMMFYVILTKVRHKYTFLAVGVTFGSIMTLINIYMGLAIFVTTLLSELSTTWMKRGNKAYYASVFFSGYTGLTTLIIMKYFIGGIFINISLQWIGFATLLCLIFGFSGAMFGKKVMKYLSFHI